MASVLELNKVTVSRSGKNLIHNITWSVEEGERWVVLGPNGAGKTTLLSIAAARLHPTRGEVDILDEILGAVDVFELRPRIGLSSAPVAAQIPGNETALDVVITAAYGVAGRWNEEYDSFDDNQGKALLDDWGVAHLADRPFGTLSEGEKKRVLIARALMTDPELMLLDEPFAGVDPISVGEIQRIVTHLKQRGIGVLITDHNVRETLGLIDRAYIIHSGAVLMEGDPEAIVSSPDVRRLYLGEEFRL